MRDTAWLLLQTATETGEGGGGDLLGIVVLGIGAFLFLALVAGAGSESSTRNTVAASDFARADWFNEEEQKHVQNLISLIDEIASFEMSLNTGSEVEFVDFVSQANDELIARLEVGKSGYNIHYRGPTGAPEEVHDSQKSLDEHHNDVSKITRRVQTAWEKFGTREDA